MEQDQKMHQLIVLGNGFDIECKLKSRTDDFLCARAKEYLGDSHWHRRQDAPPNSYVPIDRVNRYGEIAHDKGMTVWDSILEFPSRGTTEDWQGVESTIRDFFLLKLKQSQHTQRKTLFFTLPWCFYKKDPTEEDVYLKTDPQDKQYQAAINFLKADLPANNYITLPQFDALLFQQLQKLEKAFGKYINEQCQNNPSYKEKSTKLLKFLSEDELPPELNGSLPETSVLDFNYTNPATQYVQKQGIHLVNIHGTVKNPIFGIDSKGVKPDSAPFRFTKTYRLLSLENPDQKELIHTSTRTDEIPTGLIKFYGHSLGDADYSYFQAIFDGVNLYQSHTRLVFYYKPWKQSDGKGCAEAKAQQDMSNKVTKLMKEYGTTMTNKDHGENLLHKLLLEGRLTIKRYNG